MIHSPSFLGYTRLGAETTAAKTDLREVKTALFCGEPGADRSSNLTSARPG